MAIAESWHVRSRGRECAATQRPFTDGESIVTALFPDSESSGYVRRDYCAEGWKTYQESGDAPFSFWKTKYTAPSGSDTVKPEEKLSAEEILQRLVEEDEDHTENARFILAVMLERQKLLRETDSQRTPTGILRVYEHRKTGEVFIVKDPNIPLADIEAVQNEVFILLENNGRSPGAAEETVGEISEPAGKEDQSATVAEEPADEEPDRTEEESSTDLSSETEPHQS
jgi:hypothetical protein